MATALPWASASCRINLCVAADVRRLILQNRQSKIGKPELDQSFVTSAAIFNAGALVTLSPAGKPRPAPNATVAELYTCAAEVLRVVDGDTLWLKIWLKPGHWLKEKVRLRGIDCPELSTPEGKAAKRFVETLVRDATAVTVTTTNPDKWDGRYLCEVFLGSPRPSDGRGVRGEGRPDEGSDIFLNNLLLESGHARRYDKVSLTDWEE
jgi:endonuclease YncB( thermonuclease family)